MKAAQAAQVAAVPDVEDSLDRSSESVEIPSPQPLVASKALDFPSAHRPRLRRIREDMRQVVETVFLTDVSSEWRRLEDALQLGEKRSEHAHAVAALDRAATNAYRAHRLYLTARALREEWELENEVIFAAQWSKASAELQADKDNGRRSKQITDADVKARIATTEPEAYAYQEKKRREIEFTVKSLERLAEVWLGRQRDLQAIVGRIRG